MRPTSRFSPRALIAFLPLPSKILSMIARAHFVKLVAVLCAGAGSFLLATPGLASQRTGTPTPDLPPTTSIEPQGPSLACGGGAGGDPACASTEGFRSAEELGPYITRSSTPVDSAPVVVFQSQPSASGDDAERSWTPLPPACGGP